MKYDMFYKEQMGSDQRGNKGHFLLKPWCSAIRVRNCMNRQNWIGYILSEQQNGHLTGHSSKRYSRGVGDFTLTATRESDASALVIITF